MKLDKETKIVIIAIVILLLIFCSPILLFGMMVGANRMLAGPRTDLSKGVEEQERREEARRQQMAQLSEARNKQIESAADVETFSYEENEISSANKLYSTDLFEYLWALAEESSYAQDIGLSSVMFEEDEINSLTGNGYRVLPEYKSVRVSLDNTELIPYGELDIDCIFYNENAMGYDYTPIGSFIIGCSDEENAKKLSEVISKELKKSCSSTQKDVRGKGMYYEGVTASVDGEEKHRVQYLGLDKNVILFTIYWSHNDTEFIYEDNWDKLGDEVQAGMDFIWDHKYDIRSMGSRNFMSYCYNHLDSGEQSDVSDYWEWVDSIEGVHSLEDFVIAQSENGDKGFDFSDCINTMFVSDLQTDIDISRQFNDIWEFGYEDNFISNIGLKSYVFDPEYPLGCSVTMINPQVAEWIYYSGKYWGMYYNDLEMEINTYSELYPVAVHLLDYRNETGIYPDSSVIDNAEQACEEIVTSLKNDGYTAEVIEGSYDITYNLFVTSEDVTNDGTRVERVVEIFRSDCFVVVTTYWRDSGSEERVDWNMRDEYIEFYWEAY